MSKAEKMEVLKRLLEKGEYPCAVITALDWNIPINEFRKLCNSLGIEDVL